MTENLKSAKKSFENNAEKESGKSTKDKAKNMNIHDFFNDMSGKKRERNETPSQNIKQSSKKLKTGKEYLS